MKKIILVSLLFSLLLFSCNSKKQILDTSVKKQNTQVPNSQINASYFIDKHHSSNPNFTTLSGTVNVDFNNEETSQNIPLSIRLKKGEIIWLSAPFGVAKIMLTPTSINYYNKLNSTYYQGDYSLIEKKLGFPLNYTQIENIILGKLLFEDKNYSLKEQESKLIYQKDNIIIENIFNNLFRIQSFNFQDSQNKINLTTSYSYQQVEQNILPDNIKVNLNSGKVRIYLQLSSLDVNKELKFPYNLPTGYKTID